MAQPLRRFQVGGHVVATRSSQFDHTDVGPGVRFSWHPVPIIGLESELNAYPSDLPEEVPFSGARTEGLFGLTFGPRLGTIRPFARFRPGFVTFHEAPEPLACIAIFPPPLSCTLAAGRTLFALDVGGGVELFLSPTTFVRIDAGDRLVRYPGPSFDTARVARTESFFGHDFRIAAGGGLRF